MLVELNPQIFKKEVFCISSKGFNQRDAYRVMLRKYPDVMNIEQMCDALRISTKTGYKLLHEGKIPAMKIGRSYRIPKAHLFYLPSNLRSTLSSRESTVLIVLRRCVMLFLSTADRGRPKPKEVFMVAGHLQEKNGIYYVVLTYKTYDGKRKTKWQSTGLPIKGNKRRAEAMMRELQDDFEPPVDPNGPPSKAMLFADYLVQWLEIAKSTVKLTTYASYKELSNSRIIPYFRNLGVTLGDLKAVHIQAFYQEQLERVKPNTVIHYHAVIHRALKYAVKTDLIDVNPADKVDRPKKNEFTGNFYGKDEMNALFDAVRGSKIEVAVMLTAFYGLRRSEVVGLKWAAVDFEQNTIEICHTVTTVRLDGKEVLVESNGTKTKSSKRTLPLVPVFRERLLALQEEQKENRKLCGRCYNKKYADYICVDAMGNLLKPDYLSNSFQIILQNYHLRRIRFHDLRHSCASLLLANGVPMKMIQEWLGHSDFSTTANIYSHLDYASKVSSAEAMLNGLGMGSNPENDT